MVFPPITVRPGCCAGEAFATCDPCGSSSSEPSTIGANVSAASKLTHWPRGSIWAVNAFAILVAVGRSSNRHHISPSAAGFW